MKRTYEIIKEIRKLKKEKNAIILAHVYQISDVQDIADYTGDSLDLSRKATITNADVIVFCGVRFRAESAHLLNPTKTVLLPDGNAGCGFWRGKTRSSDNIKILWNGSLYNRSWRRITLFSKTDVSFSFYLVYTRYIF